ncbi:uncharacterized protein LOC116726684 isoform X1 [Xiphophorus hellerii]|uniref:uncharacterized protein LOC116726684 isoform X1 n=1 Tax=Xiphophorus hellerii TaxID=8084 RepID=UPI0013B3DACA|nr:transmembrane protein 273 isoform X1 [Xiphophorus hellerii]
MRTDQFPGCMPAVIKAFLITDCLLVNVKGDGGESDDKLDFKYVLIGGGIGLFLSALFILSKICMIRKQAEINFPGEQIHLAAAIYYFESAQPISWQRYRVTSGAKGQAECRAASG